MKNFLARIGANFILGMALFIGMMTAFAVFPEAPHGESVGGWLGSVLNLKESGTGKLIIQSEKVGIGTTNPSVKLEVSGNVIANNPEAGNHLATRDYVDTQVVAEGGAVGGGVCYYVDPGKKCGFGFVQMPGMHSEYQKTHRICCSENVVSNKDIVTKRIFVTSVGYNGNLGGEEGADAKCQARADAVRLSGTYKAWLLDGKHATKITDKFKDAMYINMRGAIVIRSFLDYEQGLTAWQNLKEYIGYDEYGDWYSYVNHNIDINVVEAWTGLNDKGEASSHGDDNCNAFYSKSARGFVGDITKMDSYYYFKAVRSCSVLNRLICVET